MLTSENQETYFHESQNFLFFRNQANEKIIF